MSTDREAPGGKELAQGALGEAKRLFEEAKAEAAVEAEQMDLFDPITAEEAALAHEELGANAGPLAVLRKVRENRRGRPPGSRNRNTNDFRAYLSQFGPDPAVAMQKIVAESEEAMVARSQQLDPLKRQISFGDARAMRIRCAEGLMPYWHGKQPVKVDATIRGVIVQENIGDHGMRGTTIDGEIVGVAISDEDGEE